MLDIMHVLVVLFSNIGKLIEFINGLNFIVQFGLYLSILAIIPLGLLIKSKCHR